MGRPCDDNGRLHAHVALQQTAAWEPFVGRTAETARSKGKGGSTFSERASVAMKWYTYKGVCADWDTTPVVFDDSKSTLTQIVKCSPSASSAFFVPFIYIFLLAMPGSDEYHAELVSRLEKCWNTFYG